MVAVLDRCLECGQGVGDGAHRAAHICADCATLFCPHCRERYRRRENGEARCVCGERRL